MDSLPLRRFHTCVARHRGNHKVKTFTCLDPFRVMAFAQLTYRQSLRDIEVCLRAMRPKLYHRGIRSVVSRNTSPTPTKYATGGFTPTSPTS